MTFLDDDTNIKKRIFDNIKTVMELEVMLDKTFKSQKINTLSALGIGSVIKESQRNILKQVRDDIDKLISD